MAISFHCTSCEKSFELEITRIIDRPTALKCPECHAKPPAHRAESLGTALEDLLSAMSGTRTKFAFKIALDTESLPPPYGPTSGENALGGEDDDDLAEGMDDEEDEDDAATDDEDEDEDSDDDGDDEDEDGEDDEAAGDDDADATSGDDDDDADDDDDEEEEEDED